MDSPLLRKYRYLLIDDDEVHLQMVKTKMTSIGIHDYMLASSYQDASQHIIEQSPDVIIADFYLDKNKTVIDILKNHKIPETTVIIVLSAYYDQDTLSQLSDYHVADLLSKSITAFDLEKALTLSLNKAKVANSQSPLKPVVFVKSGRSIVKLHVADIQYIEVDGKYLELVTESKKYFIRNALNAFMDRLPDNFIRISQSCAINLDHLVSIDIEESKVNMPSAALPFSRNYKKAMMNLYYLP